MENNASTVDDNIENEELDENKIDSQQVVSKAVLFPNNETNELIHNSVTETRGYDEEGKYNEIPNGKIADDHIKQKKKKKKRRERIAEKRELRQKDSETETGVIEEKIRKLRKKQKRRKRESFNSAMGIDNIGIANTSLIPGDVFTGFSSFENVKQVPSDELYLGANISKTIAESEIINNDSCTSNSLTYTNEKNTERCAINANLFYASEFIPGFKEIQLVENQPPQIQQTAKNGNKNNVHGTNDCVHGHYVKNEKKKTLKKKRLMTLKKTSSKVSIMSTDLPPITSRLELDPTARTARSNRKPESKSGTGDENKVEFPEPLQLCKFITKFPLLSFFAVTLIHLTTIAITVCLVFSGYDVFPVVFDDLPLYIYNDVRLQELTWRSRTSYDGYVYRPIYGYNINTGYRGKIKDTVEVIYECPGINILTPEHLNLIKTAEERLFNEINFQEDFCLLDHNNDCIRPQSLIRLFDGTYSHVDPAFNDRNFTNIKEVLYKSSVYNETKDYLQLFLGKDSVVTGTGSYTTITRSFFFMGGPLYVLRSGKWGRTEDLRVYLAGTFKPAIENIRDFYLIGSFDVYYLSKMLYEHDLLEQALVDIKLAIGSVLFIFIFMCLQTGTVVVTCLGVLSIISSYLLTNLFYRYVFQFKYFGFFHIIAIFLILGLGADDLFVFYDTWRLTGRTKYPSDAHRLSDCYRKAAKTTFVTSLTTTMAFLVSGLSPLLPVKTFGIFTGFLVAVNYLWVIIYFPSIIIIHHTKTKNLWRRFHEFLLSIWLAETMQKFPEENKSDTNSVSETNSSRELLTCSSHVHGNLPNSARKYGEPGVNVLPIISKLSSPRSSTPRVDLKDKDSRDIRADVSVTLDDDNAKYVGFNSHVAPATTLSWERIQSDASKDDYIMKKMTKPKKNFEDRNRVVKFLRNTFFDFMTNRTVKITIPLLFLGVSIFFIHRATMIQPDTHQLRLFRNNHNYAKATSRHYFSFLRNQDDEYQRLYLVWGLLPADISACDSKSADFCFGEPRYDENFDMNTESAQLAFKDLCNRLENLDPDLIDRLHIQRDSITNEAKIACFTRDFEAYFKNEIASSSRLPTDMNLSMPVSRGNVTDLINTYRSIYRTSLPDDFNNYFEILVSYWLTDGYQFNPTADYFSYNNLLSEKWIDGTTQDVYYTDSGMYYGTKLQYLAIEVNTTMNVYSLGYKEGLPIFREWEDFIHSINSKMPAPLQNGIQVTETLWHWLHVQETLTSSAIMGIMIGLLTAWPILILTTLNFIIGTLAAVTIGLVTACVIGLIPLAGWKLGVLESINLCMVVGLSVDYIVHLAEAYRMSTSTRRLDRVHDMLESIGLSVISGALTTMGAALFMLFAQIQFFFQFGIFILSTVGISLLFSLLGFTTLLSLCGPENDTGSVTKLVSRIVTFCKKGDDSVNSDIESRESDSRSSCPCAAPSVLLDRVYDWLSYRNNQQLAHALSRSTKPHRMQ